MHGRAEAQTGHKIGAIQNLRGIAVVLTVLAHEPLAQEPIRFLGLPGLYWIGVCVFYGISGYIIFLTTENKSWNDLSSFYIRRLFRIMPVMMLSCAIALMFAVAIPKSAIVNQFYPSFDTTVRAVAAQLLLIGNFEPFLGFVVPLSLVGLWTISTEAQFYFNYGAALCLPRSRRALALLIAAVVVFALKVWLFPILVVSRGFFFEIMIVAAAACAFRDNIRPNAWLLALAALYTLGFPMLPKTTPIYAVAYPLFTVAISYIVVCAGHEFRILRPSSTISRFLFWAGERSYVIYVFHFQVLAITGGVLQMLGLNYGGWWIYASLLMASQILAAPLYEFIHKAVEVPGIEMGRRLARSVSRRSEVQAPHVALLPSPGATP